MPKRFGPARKLCTKDEMLLCLMKQRLGLTLQDLANQFKVSPSTASSVFTSWVKGLSTVLRTLIFMPDKESLVNTKPQRFKILLKTFILLLMQVRYSLRHQKILMIRKKPGQNTNIIIL